MPETSLRWCAVCRRDTELEPVPCPDEHGADCPDLVCARCCTVLVVGAVVHPGVAPAPAGARAQSRPVRRSRAA